MSLSEDLGSRCKNCKYSHSVKVFDPVLSVINIPDGFRLGTERIETKCHIQGRPQPVDPDRDWCFSYSPKLQKENAN